MSPGRALRSVLLALCVGSPRAEGAAGADETASPAGSGEVVVERVVAVVGRNPVTQGQVDFEAAVRKRVTLAEDRARFGRLLAEPWVPLEAVIFRYVLAAHPLARDLPAPDEATARDRLLAFSSTFPDGAAYEGWLAEWRLSEGALLDWFREGVRLDLAVVTAVDPLVRTSRQDELAYYEENRDRIFAGRPFAEVEGYVARQVYALQFGRAWQAWASQIRAQARVRYVGRGR